MQAVTDELIGSGRVELEAPLDVRAEDNTYNEPEANLKILRRLSQEYAFNLQPEDVLLVVEISDSTVQFDLSRKAELYARAATMEYWVLDIPAKRLVVHQEPEQRRHRSIIAYDAQEEITPLVAPEAQFGLERCGGF